VLGSPDRAAVRGAPLPGFAGTHPNAHSVRWGEKQRPRFLPQERSDVGGGGPEGRKGHPTARQAQADCQKRVIGLYKAGASCAQNRADDGWDRPSRFRRSS
jgi:hypothetical protein